MPKKSQINECSDKGDNKKFRGLRKHPNQMQYLNT